MFYWVQYLDQDGQWRFPGEPIECAYANELEAHRAKKHLDKAWTSVGGIDGWRVVRSAKVP